MWDSMWPSCGDRLADMTDLGEYGDKLAGIAFIYPQIAQAMIDNGWQVVWGTLNESDEWSPDTGVTGGQVPFPVNRPMPQGQPVRIAFRPPPSVIVIDVDHYAFKTGGYTIERAEEALSLLPATWKVTSRGAADLSGRYLYKIPASLDTSQWERALKHFGELETRGVKTAMFSDVEIVRTGHRFSWAPGDINPKNGKLVECYGPDGEVSTLPPVDEVPDLPVEWLDFFRDPPAPKVVAQREFIDIHSPEWWKNVPAESIGTRDELCSYALSLLTAGLNREEATAELWRVAANLDDSDPWKACDFKGMTDGNTQWKADTKRNEEIMVTEFARAALGQELAVRKVEEAQRVYQEHVTNNPMPLPGAVEFDVPIIPTPTVPAEDLSQLALTMRFNLDAETGCVRPTGGDDRAVALDVLERQMWHVKFASDAGHWLINHGREWVDFGNKTEAEARARALVFAYGVLLEPIPPEAFKKPEDPDAEDPYKTLKLLHKKLTSSAGVGAVARAVTSIAMGNPGTCVRVCECDTEPNVLWAGGIPWDLLSSVDHPQPAEEGTYEWVHRRTAAYVPDWTVPTPYWDRYLMAVWPDPEVRAYALREICGVALWGATSKQHPVLHGPASSGKSTFAEQLMKLLGTYAVQVSPNKLLTGRSDSTAEEEYSKLIGARLAWMDEPPSRRKQVVSEFNEMASGTGTISAAAKYKNVVTAPKLFNFLICQNPRNPLSFDAEGVSERTIFIPCLAKPEATVNPRLEMLAAFEQEAPGILAKLIVECARYRGGDRFSVPQGVKEAFEAARHTMNDWGQTFLYLFQPGAEDTPQYRMMTLGQVTRAVNTELKTSLQNSEAAAHVEKLGFEVFPASSKNRNQPRVNVTWAPQVATIAQGMR